MGAQNSLNTPYQNMIIVTFLHDIHVHLIKGYFWVDYSAMITTNYKIFRFCQLFKMHLLSQF